MTCIEFCRGGDFQRLSAEGHAGYDSAGRDIVCAGISAICYALLGFLENEAAQTSEYAYLTESGRLYVEAAALPRVDAAFDMALIGLMQLEKQYPDHLNIHISAAGGDTREETAQ